MKEIISIWKPENITSYDVIRKIKFFDSSLKIGHCGTLDPFASGILLICIGSNTKNISEYMNLQKTYEATIKLNTETDTLDHTGKIIKIKSNPITLKENDIKKSILKLTGKNIFQVPPFFSAKKFHGIKMYEFARKNIFIRRKPSIVSIHSIKLLEFSNNFIKIKVKCGKGVYIRAIARDLANYLNTFGHLTELIRTDIGKYNFSNSYNLEDLKNVCSWIIWF